MKKIFEKKHNVAHKENTIFYLIWFITQEFNTWKSNFEKKLVDQKFYL